jgi:hypothetical protein
MPKAANKRGEGVTDQRRVEMIEVARTEHDQPAEDHRDQQSPCGGDRFLGLRPRHW